MLARLLSILCAAPGPACGRKGWDPKKNVKILLCDTKFMAAVTDPKSGKVNLSTGTGLDIEWKDGHQSHYSFPFLRDACPCALCDEQRGKTHQEPGEPAKL